jgi:hypothetical protein
MAQPNARSSNSQGSAPNSRRSARASGESSQNGISWGMANFSGRKKLAPTANRIVPRITLGHEALSAPGRSNILRVIAAARPADASAR